MFSVVIPVYNHERYLTECVLSAARSPLVSEVLLLDDGSSDNSAALARKLSGGALAKVRDVTLPGRGNLGAHATLNELVKLATSEWIAVLNSDDVFTPSRFELIRRRMRYRAFDLAFGHVLVIDSKSHQLGGKRAMFDPQLPFPKNFDVPAMARQGDWLPLLAHQNFLATTSNLIFRKTLFDKIGGFADLRYVHDWDFCLRAALLGRVEYLPHALLSYRVHAANTIKEDSGKVDREVEAMFAKLLEDFPLLQQNEAFAEGLAANPYLQRRPQPLLSIVLPQDESRDFYRLTLEPAFQGIEFVDANPTGRYVYRPASLLNALNTKHLQNAVLALEFQELDYLLIHHSLSEVSVTCPPGEGVVARLFPGGGVLSTIEALPRSGRDRPVPMPVTIKPPQPDPRPMVFVLPALFAVGGVERLVIDMTRQLAPHYRFVIITVERLQENQGSLHGAAEGTTHGFYDLAEIAPPRLFLPMLERLRDIYKPALVWIPNGSPWQCDNAAQIRRVFAGIPIVDQQVYDTEAGWISRYHDPGIQSYDRFIAINRKIEQTFINKYGIPADRIDMIYHSVNLQALGPPRRTPQPMPVFGWVGRFTVQKRPLEFLEFVRAMPDHRFLMIGDGELGAKADAFIEQNALKNVSRVRFSDRMGELFATMDGLLSASEYEGLPISMLEALAMGVPIYSTDVGDVALILEEYGTGAITPCDWNLARYSAGFETWLGHLDRYRENAIKAAPLIRERFGSVAVAAQYEKSFVRATLECSHFREND